MVKTDCERKFKMKKSTLLIKSALLLIACWLASFVITTFFPMLYFKYGVLMCLLFGFCSLGASLAIYADFCWKAGGKMNTRSMQIQNTVDTDQNFGAIIGAVPTVINYLYVIPLFLSKFGVIKSDFFPLYKTLTFYFMPFTYIFAPNKIVYSADGAASTVNIAAQDLNAGMLILAVILPLTFLFACWAAFYVGYNHIDLKERILYGKNK